MRNLRATHRLVTLIVVLFTVYLGVTGTLIQLIDLRTLFAAIPASDANFRAMHEGIDGNGGFSVISTADYTGDSLGAKEGYAAALALVLQAARTQVDAAPLRYIELRMVDGQSIGQVESQGRVLRFDARTGSYLGGGPIVHPDESPASERNTVKHLHRMTTFGDWALFINVIVGIGLAVLIVTGLWMFCKMWMPRVRVGKTNPLWTGGSWWRVLHRSVSILSAVFLSIVVFSGLWLAYESLYFGIHLKLHPAAMREANADAITPLDDAALQGMLRVTVNAYGAVVPGVPPRVIRLRNYGGMAQGVVISGGSSEAKQYAFNAVTGTHASETEPGYPPSMFPFGWQAHQYAKMMHRGDLFGISGRLMDLLAGLAMIYLSISGIVMYYQLWIRRRQQGRSAPVWS